jgi:hypothetical protein
MFRRVPLIGRMNLFPAQLSHQQREGYAPLLQEEAGLDATAADSTVLRPTRDDDEEDASLDFRKLLNET